MVKYIILLVFFGISSGAHALESALGPLSSLFNLDQIDQANSFVINIEKDIEGLKKRRGEQEEIGKAYNYEKEQTQALLNSLRDKLKKASGNELEFLKQQTAALSETVEVLTEIGRVNQHILALFDEHIKLLQELKQDPEFKSKISIPAKSVYSLEDLLKVTELVLDYESRLRNLEENSRKAVLDLDNRQKALGLARQEYEEKRKEQRELKNQEESFGQAAGTSRFTLQQQGELLDAQERLFRYKKELAEFQIKEIELRERLIDEHIKIVNRQLDIVYKAYTTIKRELRIDEKEVQKAQDQLQQLSQQSLKNQEHYTKQIETLTSVGDKDAQKVSALKQKYTLTDADSEAMSNWTYKPKTVAQWGILIELGKLKNSLNYTIEINKEDLAAQIELEKTKLHEHYITTLIITSWKKLTIDRIGPDEITREIKHYEKEKADIQGQLSLLTDRRASAVNSLNNNARLVDTIKERLKELKEQKETVFKNNQAEFNKYRKQLEEELTEIQARSDMITHLIELYASISNLKAQEIKKIDFIIDELRSRIQWRTSPPLWRGLQSFLPDVRRFVKYITEKDITQSISLNKQTLQDLTAYYSDNIYHFFYLLSWIAIIILSYFVARLWLPELKKILATITPQFGMGHTISSFASAVLTFIHNHLLSIFIWLLLYISIRYHIVKDIYTGVLFYLLSIPYWLMQARKFVRFIAHENIHHDYIFVSSRYQSRFLTVFSVLLYATISILFFREAFLWAPLAKSDVPTMLLAFNFILLQVSLISLIGREQILNIIPRTTPLWQWIYDHIKKYYYLFLGAAIFIIIMSNPYVGYGPQFFYIITRLLLISLTIPFFVTIHNQLKRVSGSLFFYSDGDVIRERFPYGRTLYGLFVIVSFLAFVALAFIIAANIWGYHIGWRDISDWLHREIYLFKDPNTGRTVPVSTIVLSKVLLYVIGGIAIAYTVNKFLLKRMFDLLLVNIGVQNAVLSITRSIIILVAIILGLQSIGLSTSLLYVFAVIGGLGVAGKEFISDFIGYFVILIQRPIKIGDLIRIDGEVSGVVRQVTLRSVVIRRKNSVTVIVPNSHVMTKPVTNWSYSRTFFAFDDILLTIPYTADPSLAKELILKVLLANINILKNPAPVVWLNDFTEIGFQFLVRGFLSPDKVLEQFDIASDIRLELVKILRAHNIEVASPTRILRVIQQQKATDITNPEI